jgi:hypothetical protein
LAVYFVLALWLFRGRNCGYGQVMIKLVDGLYHRRRARDLLDGVVPDPDGWVAAGEGRRWRRPNISSLSRARARLGADPLHMLFDSVAGPVGADDAVGVFCRGLRVVSVDGSSTDVPDTTDNARYFGRPSNGTRDGAFPQVRWLAAAESETGALIGATIGAYIVGEQTQFRDLLSAFGPDMMVLADRNFLSHTLARDVLATGAHILWRASASCRLAPMQVLDDGSYLARLNPARKADARRSRCGSSSMTWPWPRSCSRSSTQASSSATPQPRQPTTHQQDRRLPRPQARRAQRYHRHPTHPAPQPQPQATGLNARPLGSPPVARYRC